MFLSVGQRRNIGKAREKPLEIGSDCGHLGLLEHDLADPDGIRISRPAPGQVPRVTAEPCERRRRNDRRHTASGKAAGSSEFVLERPIPLLYCRDAYVTGTPETAGEP